MARNERLAALSKIESIRSSRVITYVCSHRENLPAQIGEDAVREMYDHVRAIGKVDNLDLFLCSLGGSVEVPWKLISMLREYCNKRLAVIIPYRAHSAATLIALGCDEIVMSPKAELGPVDPALRLQVDGDIRVEDVMSYVDFLRKKADLTDQTALSANIRLLGEKLSPWTIGSLYRTHSHIRMVARKLIMARNIKITDEAMKTIIDTLAETISSHGHGIPRHEARAIGLPVVDPDAPLETAMWELFEDYEKLMEMRTPLDGESILGADDEKTISAIIAAVESQSITSAMRGSMRLRRIRQTPAQVGTNVTLTVNLPPGLDQALVPQQIIQQLLQQVQTAVPGMVQQQVKAQSPITGIEARPVGLRWQVVTAEGI